MKLRFALCLACAALSCGDPPAEETDGQGDAPALGARGESCEAPQALVLGARTYAALEGADADVELSCGASALPDRVFAVEVPEDGVLSARLDTESALAVAIFSDGACASADEAACAAEATWDGAVSAPVTAGTWLVVVKGESEERFGLDVDLLPPACEGDGLDSIPLDGSFPGNPIAGDASTGVIDQDPQTPDRQTGPMRLCPGDVDGFFFAHLGGSLTIDAQDAPWVLRPVTIDVQNFGNPYVPTLRREGHDIDYAAIAADAPPGYYMIRLRADLLGEESSASDPLEYTLTIAHACSGDRDDSPIPEIDDGTTSAASLLSRGRVYIADRDAVTYSICREDTDAFLLAPATTGTIEVNLGNMASLGTEVTFLPNDTILDPEPVSLPVAAERRLDPGDARLSIPVDRIDGRYRVHISLLDEQPTTLRYGMSLEFLYDVPDNDTCAGAEPIAPTPELTTLLGNNAGGASDVVGLCNLDATAPADLQGTEVFYALSIAEQTNLELAVAAASTFWSGTASVYRLPDGVCPADLTTLVPVKRNGADLADGEPPSFAACGPLRVRTALQPGEYVVAVEGTAGNVAPAISPRQGAFTLSMQTFPDGFPVAAACEDPPSFTLPAAGESETFPIPTPSPHELRATCGGNGDESVLMFTTDAVQTVTIRTAPPHDTVLSIALGTCDGGAELACNDDRMGHTGYESEVTFQTVPDTPTFVIVDKYGLNTVTPANAAIEVTVAP